MSLSRVQLFATPWTVALPGSSVHGIFQERILDWVAISFSRETSRNKRNSSPWRWRRTYCKSSDTLWLCLNCVDESASLGDLSSPFQLPLNPTAVPSSLLVTRGPLWGEVERGGEGWDGAGRGGPPAPPQEATVRASGASTPLSSGKVVSGVGSRTMNPPSSILGR